VTVVNAYIIGLVTTVAIFRRVQKCILRIAHPFLSIFPRGFHSRDRISWAHVYDFGHVTWSPVAINGGDHQVTTGDHE
jgi:hypothetical protein